MGGRGDVNNQPNTCQYGWPADRDCDAWGTPSPFHGCSLVDGHHGGCKCLCADQRYMHGSRRRWRNVDGQAA